MKKPKGVVWMGVKHTWMAPKDVVKAVQQAQVKPLQKAGLLVERSAKDNMEGAGRRIYVTGRTRKTGERGKKRTRKQIVYTPAPAGSPPHIRTGVLRASIATAPTDRETVVVGPTSPPAPYGQHLEFGTRRMEPRPFMRPALMRTRTQFSKLWKSLRLAHTPAGRALNRRKS